MQCPGCGYEVDDASVFCPHCRFPFWETGDTPVVPATTVPEPSVQDSGFDESIFEEEPTGLPAGGKQCPNCGYVVDDASVFCPHCRFQFRTIGDTPFVPSATIPGSPAQDTVTGRGTFKTRKNAFSVKELKKLEVQLMQPAFLVVLILSLFTYTVISTVPFLPITVAGLDFGVWGIISLAAGLLGGIVFYFLTRRSLLKFRFR